MAGSFIFESGSPTEMLAEIVEFALRRAQILEILDDKGIILLVVDVDLVFPLVHEAELGLVVVKTFDAADGVGYLGIKSLADNILVGVVVEVVL